MDFLQVEAVQAAQLEYSQEGDSHPEEGTQGFRMGSLCLRRPHKTLEAFSPVLRPVLVGLLF